MTSTWQIVRQLVLKRITIATLSETARILDKLDLCFDDILLCSSLTDFSHEPILCGLVHVLVVVFADLRASEEQANGARRSGSSNTEIDRAVSRKRERLV